MMRTVTMVAALTSVALVVSFSTPQSARSADIGKGTGPVAIKTRTLEGTSLELVARAEHLRRTDGPAALERLLAEFDRMNPQTPPDGKALPFGTLLAVSADEDAPRKRLSNEDRKKLAELEQLIDLVGGQKHCTTSRLYWYTDLEVAKSAARSSGKPILSLRMLGRLTDDLSCANSRFFRVVLYSNPEVARFLRETFVMHWAAFAAAPQITIDFGDGRKIVRTITGNSIHYVLNSEGQVVDGLPGLYSPKAFLNGLHEIVALVQSMRTETQEADRAALFAKYHDQRLSLLLTTWNENVQFPAHVIARFKIPSAWLEPVRDHAELQKRIAEIDRAGHIEFWSMLAAARSQRQVLDETSMKMITAMQPLAVAAGRRAQGKSGVESPLMRLIRNFTGAVSIDTVRNEFGMHSTIHTWLRTGPTELESFNDRVYAELFLMPRTDPWLGLSQPDVFSALPNAGLIEPR